MQIVYSGRRRGDAAVEAELDARFIEFDELLATRDVVSLHCPLTPETRHLIDRDRLRQMRRAPFSSTPRAGPWSTRLRWPRRWPRA